MNGRSEEHAVREVQDRLCARFPDLHPAVVGEAVHTAHRELTGPVREFVPVLVEHIARDRLTRTATAERQDDPQRVADEATSTQYHEHVKAEPRRHRR